MKLLLLVATLVTATCLVITASVAPVPATVVTYVPHDKVAATMVKGGSIINDNGLTVLANRRGATEAESHAKNTHVFIIVEGEATLITGGSMIDVRQTTPDEMRSASIEGGQAYHLTKGDVITIPAKTPHWFKEVPTGTIAYYAVNVQTQ